MRTPIICIAFLVFCGLGVHVAHGNQVVHNARVDGVSEQGIVVDDHGLILSPAVECYTAAGAPTDCRRLLSVGANITYELDARREAIRIWEYAPYQGE
ncbi:MAG: hypothetical protein WCZ86_07515 [Desulfurivibrionaceae bacterium]